MTKLKKITLKKIIDRLLFLFQKLYENEKKKLMICGSGTTLYMSSIVDNLSRNRSDIEVGDDTHIRGHLLVLPNGGSIKIGNLCYVGENTKIWSMSSILIGNNVLISHGVNIHDNISHPISAESRRRQAFEIFKGGGHPSELPDVPAKPIVIEDDVWVGFNATILKGVRIGRGAIIGACSMVTGDVNPYSIVVGNPARVIGQATP